MEFNNHFDEESKNYNYFSLDEEDIPALRSFTEQIKYIDTDSTIFVAAYGYEITSSKGEKSTYADTLWINGVCCNTVRQCGRIQKRKKGKGFYGRE